MSEFHKFLLDLQSRFTVCFVSYKQIKHISIPAFYIKQYNHRIVKYVLILAILLIPFSTVYGYEEFQLEPDYHLYSEPTVCLSAPNEGEHRE